MIKEGYIEKGFEPQDSDIEKVNRYTRTTFNADQLYMFSVVLCSNEVDRDNEKFSIEALEEMKTLFLGKTGISDHSMRSSDQKARIYDTWVEQAKGRKAADGADLYLLKAKAYMVRNEQNEPLITEIEAGIKREVSISCSMKKCVCSICGKDKNKQHCGHIAGREYDGKTAFSILSDASDAYEFSFVAVPAQREAGVIKSFTTDKKDVTYTDIINTLKNCNSQITLTSDEARAVVKKMDELEENATLGREYKKNLTNEVVALCAKAMPKMDIKTFSGVAQVMTTKELLSFKKAFALDNSSNDVSLQLEAARDITGKNNSYKL